MDLGFVGSVLNRSPIEQCHLDSRVVIQSELHIIRVVYVVTPKGCVIGRELVIADALECEFSLSRNCDLLCFLGVEGLDSRGAALVFYKRAGHS